MIKVAFVMMIVGFVNAVIAMGITWHLNAQRPIDPSALRAWSKVVIWIWPTAIMMMAGDSDSSVTSGIIVGVISAVFNACVYAMVGLVIGAIWQKLAAPMR
jgi:hypothetical protein